MEVFYMIQNSPFGTVLSITAIVSHVVHRFDSSERGCVFLKEMRCQCWNNTPCPEEFWQSSNHTSSSPIPPPRLSCDQERYLHKNISEFCRSDVRDITCPPADDDSEEETDPEEGWAT